MSKFVLRYAERLRFPQLLVLAGMLFTLDLFIPDLIPFADELLLGLLTLLFGVWRRGSDAAEVVAKPPEKDITPPSGTE
ncbi:MAG: hypothetical protein K8J08_22085 [Thermoanaerobaculia bacterium]|nr:hypothetical protein [Thermoanaerobaculia bacterium]